MDKHSSLVCHNVSKEEKSPITPKAKSFITPGADVSKLFTAVIYEWAK
jgi:hypothetical protein